MKKFTVVILFLVLLGTVIAGAYVWWWLPAQMPKVPLFHSVKGAWMGIRPDATGILMPYYEKTQAHSYNEFVSADLTVTVFTLDTESSEDEISLQVSLDAKRNASNNIKPIHLQALKVRTHDHNDTRAFASFDIGYSSGQNVDLQRTTVADAWLDKEASTEVPVIGDDPLNASFSIMLKWRIYESQSERNRAHSFNITGAIYYYESAVLGLANTWFIETSVELNLIPGHLLSIGDFDSGSLEGWSVSDNNLSSGSDFWDITDRDYFSPSFSVWCASHNDGTPSTGLYDNGMDAYMRRDFDFSGFKKVYLYFKTWIETQENHDYLYVEYYDSGSWKTAASYSGPMSTSPDMAGVTHYDGWLNAMLELPASAAKLQFRFHSDESIVYKGSYLDNIVLLASA